MDAVKCRIDLRADVLALGALNGLGYGLLAVGLVLAFRASRVLNLAHGQVGLFAATVLALMVQRWDAPYWIAFPVALAAGALLSAGVEVLVVRRLSRAPVLVTLIATLGVAELLRFGGGAVAARLPTGVRYPEPPGVPQFEVGALLVTRASTALLLLGPVAVVLLGLLLTRSDLGLRMRAAAANPDGARLLGTPAGRYRTLTWGLAGALAALTTVLLVPGGAALTADGLGPGLLLRALAAAALAGMASAPGALAAGVGIGALEAVVRWNTRDGGAGDLAVVAVLLVALAAQRRPWSRGEAPGAWAAVEGWRPLPPAVRAVPLVRWAPALAGGACLAAVLLLPLVLQPEIEVRLAGAACFALVGLSVWAVSGLGGELSLGQVAFAAVGALASLAIARATGSPALGLAAAPVAGAAAAVVVSVPAARAGSLGVAVATLGVAYVMDVWALHRPWALGEATAVPDLGIGGLSTADPPVAFVLAVTAVAAGVALVSGVRRSSLGRRLVAARDNASAARALGIDPVAARADALALGGAIAGGAGALLAHVLGRIGPDTFPVAMGIAVVAMAVVGGLGVAGGAVLGALWIVVLPASVDVSSAGLAASAFGWLVLLLYFPGGLAAALAPVRDLCVRGLLRLTAQDGAADGDGPAADPTPPAAVRLRSGRPPADLRLEGLVKRYGPVTAVDGVDVTVGPGEIVAVVGPNGAGKTTLLDLASGFARPDAGRVLLDGEDVTALPVHVRARRGLGRSFQDAALFATLTVAEVVRLAADRRGAPAAAAVDALAAFGLSGYADARVRELSTGVRRLTELACVLTLDPRFLLLDEPSSGLAQAETSALAPLLARVRDELGIGMLVIEHDTRLVAQIADRVVVLEQGRIAGRHETEAAPAPREPVVTA